MLWLVLTDLWATKPHKPLFSPHACTLPPKHCLSLSSLTVVYSQQQLDSLISCCLTGPPPWIRDRSETLNLASLCLGTPPSLCFTWLSHPSCLVTSEGGYQCTTIAIIDPEAGTGLAALHAGSPEQPPEQVVICKRWEKNKRVALNGSSKREMERAWNQTERGTLIKQMQAFEQTGRESQWHDNKHDCVYNN